MIQKARLGKTGLMVSRVAMGGIPIQRLSKQEAVSLLHKAYDGGINFYDTAHVYTDSEEKIGAAFAGEKRSKVILASKTMSTTYHEAMAQIDESLRRLKTDYIDLYQWHNPQNIEHFQLGYGPYQALQDAKREGKIRFIGISSHHLSRASAAIESGAFDTLQFPLSLLSSQEEIDLSYKCGSYEMGFISRKGMAGGRIKDACLAFTFINQYSHIVPVWGIERPEELEQLLDAAAHPRPFTPEMQAEAERLRREVGVEYCRGCGSCLPCTAKITIPEMMRDMFFINRYPEDNQFTEQQLEEVRRIDNCDECKGCIAKCPWHLNVPRILKQHKTNFLKFYGQRAVGTGS